jgi:protein-tyrosine phosphatase
MAAAVVRQLLGPSVRVESAGLDADEGASATKDAVRVMRERGLDVSAHSSRPSESVKLADFDLLVALTPRISKELERVWRGPKRVKTLNVADPYGKGTDVCRAAAVSIEQQLIELFPQ